MARIVALMAVAVLAAAPAAALAAAGPPEPQASPFQQAPAQNQVGEQPTEPQPAPRTQTQADNGSISAGEGLLIGAGLVVLIGAIWLAIARDARRVTAGRLPADAPIGRSATRPARRSRRLSASERRRRKRGRAAK